MLPSALPPAAGTSAAALPAIVPASQQPDPTLSPGYAALNDAFTNNTLGNKSTVGARNLNAARTSFNKAVAGFHFPTIDDAYSRLGTLRSVANDLASNLISYENNLNSQGTMDALQTHAQLPLSQVGKKQTTLPELLDSLNAAVANYRNRASQKNVDLTHFASVLVAVNRYTEALALESGAAQINHSSSSLPSWNVQGANMTPENLHRRILRTQKQNAHALASLGRNAFEARLSPQTPAEELNSSNQDIPDPAPDFSDAQVEPSAHLVENTSNAMPFDNISIRSELPGYPIVGDQPGSANRHHELLSDDGASRPQVTVPPVHDPLNTELIPVTDEQTQRVDQILHKLLNTHERALSKSWRYGFLATPDKQLDQLKEMLASTELGQRPLREYILNGLLESFPPLPQHFQFSHRSKALRLIQRYLAPNTLDTENYHHSPIALRASNGDRIDQSILVSDPSLVDLLSKLLSVTVRWSGHSTEIVNILSDNLIRLRTENPQCHSALLRQLDLRYPAIQSNAILRSRIDALLVRELFDLLRRFLEFRANSGGVVVSEAHIETGNVLHWQLRQAYGWLRSRENMRHRLSRNQYLAELYPVHRDGRSEEDNRLAQEIRDLRRNLVNTISVWVGGQGG